MACQGFFRTQFFENSFEAPLIDGGGNVMNRAARSGDNDDGDPNTDLVVRCSNVQRNIFNEANGCKLSFDEDACVSVPLDGAPGVCCFCTFVSNNCASVSAF